VDGTIAIVVAAITAVGGVIGAMVQRGRKENTRDHASVIARLDKVQESIGEVQQSVVSHLTWHNRTRKK
jgi:uncharacterized membrane-anchored protein YhcB (DUF1043 family)